MIKPKALKPGDTIGLVGPSGAIRIENGLEQAVEVLKGFGYKVKVGKSAGARYGYLSGSDDLRARDVNEMFLDDEVDAIFCTRGGYGTPRILDKLDYDAARKHPKMFVGFSDITAMHAAYNRYSDLVTFHGPMPASSMLGEFDEYSKINFLHAISSTEPLGEMKNFETQKLKCVQEGKARGMMVGGCLSLVAQLIGTPYELDCKDRILFLEDVGERTYRVDGMINQLRLAGKFDECAGIVLGDFTNCTVEYPNYGCTLDDIIRDLIMPCGKPIVKDLCAGHGPHKLTLPFGIEYELDATERRLTALESALV